ncbi:uncharacterized protein METZ01_LOCUS114999 [marine metagenome]|uniref:DUF2087 domain-containing protein n=1 Tax=marine metagenome TaxID=408172 RepID=A0A381XBK9_9ZZZZ
MTQNALINEFDEIIRWPKKQSDKTYIIEFLSSKFEFDKQYSEKDVNVIIHHYHSFNDVPLLRRELISRRYLARKDDGSRYWKIK